MNVLQKSRFVNPLNRHLSNIHKKTLLQTGYTGLFEKLPLSGSYGRDSRDSGFGNLMRFTIKKRLDLIYHKT